MRYKIVIIILFCFFSTGWSQTSNGLLDKKIDFTVDNKTITTTLKKLGDQTGIDFTFSSSFFRKTPPISLSKKQTSVSDILHEILKNTGITFKTLGESRVLLFKINNETYIVSGYVEDVETGERIVGAQVFCSQQNRGTITNEYGFFSFFLDAGEISLFCRSVGYKTITPSSFLLKKNKQQTIQLYPKENLPVIVVNADQTKNLDRPIEIDHNNSIELSNNFVAHSPSLFGQADQIRVAQLLPGIQASGDGFGGINVRGNEIGHNLMLMDGIPIYIPYHLLGLYSIYNPETIKSTKIFKSHLPARYGSAASSVMDVRLREGNINKWKGNATVNLMNIGLTVEGPLRKQKGSLLIAGRLSPSIEKITSVVNRLYFSDIARDLRFFFYDISVKSNYKLSKKDRIYWSFFNGGDLILDFSEDDFLAQYSTSNQTNLLWQNVLSALRWNHLFNERLFFNGTLTYSNYRNFYSSFKRFASKEPDSYQSEEYITDNRWLNLDVGIKLDWDYTINKLHALRFGLNHNYRNFRPNFYYSFNKSDTLQEDAGLKFDFEEYYNTTPNPNPTYIINESAVYIEDHIKWKKWYINAGIRTSSFFHENANFVNLEPRLLIKNKTSAKITTALTLNRRNQYLHLIPSPTAQLSNDLWLPASKKYKPLDLYEIDLSLFVTPLKNMKTTVSAYYRHTNNLLAFPDTLNVYTEIKTFSNYDVFEVGKGFTKGLEFMTSYTHKNTSVLFSYALAKTERQFTSINLGKRYPSKYDSRHQFNISLNQKIGNYFRVDFNYMLQSPTPKVGVLLFDEAEINSNYDFNPIGKKNNERNTKGYSRLDISLSVKFKTKRIHHFIQFGFYNTLNKTNINHYEVFEYQNLFDETKLEKEVSPLSAFNRMASFSYKIGF